MVGPEKGLWQDVPPVTVAMLMVEKIVSHLRPAPVRPVDHAVELFVLAYRVSLRFVTKTLILALFLLSAITFSTETIPNFQPDCEVSSARKATTVSTIKIVQPCLLPPLRQERAQPPSDVSPSPLLPPSRIARFTAPSRAPPVPLF